MPVNTGVRIIGRAVVSMHCISAYPDVQTGETRGTDEPIIAVAHDFETQCKS